MTLTQRAEAIELAKKQESRGKGGAMSGIKTFVKGVFGVEEAHATGGIAAVAATTAEFEALLARFAPTLVGIAGGEGTAAVFALTALYSAATDPTAQGFFRQMGQNIAEFEATDQVDDWLALSSPKNDAKQTSKDVQKDLSGSSGMPDPDDGDFDPYDHDFKNNEEFDSYYEKHNKEWGDKISREEYVSRSRALMRKKADENILEKVRENGDIMKYNVRENEFLVVDKNGNIRTFFKPESKLEYWSKLK